MADMPILISTTFASNNNNHHTSRNLVRGLHCLHRVLSLDDRAFHVDQADNESNTAFSNIQRRVPTEIEATCDLARLHKPGRLPVKPVSGTVE